MADKNNGTNLMIQGGEFLQKAVFSTRFLLSLPQCRQGKFYCGEEKPIGLDEINPDSALKFLHRNMRHFVAHFGYLAKNSRVNDRKEHRGAMNDRQKRALEIRRTDVEGAIRRFSGNEVLYILCLRAFISDSTVARMNEAIRAGMWDEAFTAAHALKGLAGNMGFIPLMHATGQLLIAIRAGQSKEITEYLENANSQYHDITAAIQKNFVNLKGITV